MSQRWDLISFDKAQFQQHKQLGSQLQRANAVAAEALLTLRRFRAGQKRHQQVCADLRNIVRRMTVLIGCCEQIATSGFQEQFTRIEVLFGSYCEHCEKTGRNADRSTLQDHIRTLEADPAWGVLVKYLLLQATSTIHHAVGGECSSLTEFEESPRCLQDLTKVLLRQQRHLAQVGSARAPEIVVAYDHEHVCPKCGNPIEGGPLGDDDDASSPGIT